MAAKASTVVFLPTGLRGSVAPGTRLDQAAQQLGADLQSLCGGQGKCGKCRVQSHSPTSALSPSTAAEADALTPDERRHGWRLACQARVLGDVTIDIPESSRSGHPVICKAPGPQSAAPDPMVHRRTLRIAPADLSAPTADWERLAAGLVKAGEIMAPTPDPAVIKGLPALMRQNEGNLTAVLDTNGRCKGILPSPATPLVGVALDIGTTSLAAYLCNLETGAVLATASAINPQVSFGEDVISRIAHAAAAKTGQAQLQEAVIAAVNRLLARLADQSGVPTAAMADMVCVGNTCMHHLFLGIDCTGLGRAPFAPAVFRGLDVPARDLGLDILPGASVHFLPLVSGFVGADTVGALLAVAPALEEKTILLVDVGTNGEIVLAGQDRMVCASCATGPALEGATLRHGMRAADGAIERVWIDPDTLNVRCRVIGDAPGRPVPAAGICGSGIIDAVAQMVATGIVGPNGRIDRSANSPRVVGDQQNTAFVLVPAEQSATGRPIRVDQEDIRAVQMAKGAIHAAVLLLMEAIGVTTVDRVLLCGAFGSVIDPRSAATIGLIPDFPVERVSAVGNAAGDGARLALLNRAKRAEAVRLARHLEYIELTLHPRFQREFAMAMYFPHMHPGKAKKQKPKERR